MSQGGKKKNGRNNFCGRSNETDDCSCGWNCSSVGVNHQILLVIASGGVIRWMLQNSGLGNIIGPVLEKSGLPLILIAFLIALLVRFSVGSSIVAMTMASGIMATMPAVMDTSMIYRAAMCCAICGGATALSHVNDAGFWLAASFLEIDEKTTLKSWTIMETLIGFTALIVSFIVSIFA